MRTVSAEAQTHKRRKSDKAKMPFMSNCKLLCRCGTGRFTLLTLGHLGLHEGLPLGRKRVNIRLLVEHVLSCLFLRGGELRLVATTSYKGYGRQDNYDWYEFHVFYVLLVLGSAF